MAGHRFGQGQFFATNAGQNLVHTRLNATRVIAVAQRGGDGLVQNAAGQQVGYRTFERFGGCDAHAPIVFGDHKQQTVAHAGAANFPSIAQPLGVSRDVFGRGAGQHQHNDLGAPLGLKGGELVFQCGQPVRGQRAGLVHDPGAQFGQGLHVLGMRCHRQQACQQHGQQPTQPMQRATAWTNCKQGKEVHQRFCLHIRAC